MEEFKLKKIKKLDDVKKIFNFISSAFYQESIFGEAYIPLHELYEIMVENLVRNKELQFYGMLNKEIIGAVVSNIVPYDPKCLEVNIIAVRSSFRRSGFASVLLAEIEMIAKRKGFERIRVKHNSGVEHFLTKKNYKLLLELAIPETLQIEDVLKINNLALQYENLTRFNDINFVEYSVENADKKILKYISSSAPLVKASYIMEKSFKKN